MQEQAICWISQICWSVHVDKVWDITGCEGEFVLGDRTMSVILSAVEQNSNEILALSLPKNNPFSTEGEISNCQQWHHVTKLNH